MARPQARLTAPPNGACTTSCMPPVSSKNRSKTTRRQVGSSPIAAFCGRRVGHGLTGRLFRATGLGDDPPLGARPDRSAAARDLRETARLPHDSSSVRPGASPSQNGMVAGRPVRRRRAPRRRERAGFATTYCPAETRRPACFRRRNPRPACRRPFRPVRRPRGTSRFGNRAGVGDRGQARPFAGLEPACRRGRDADRRGLRPVSRAIPSDRYSIVRSNSVRARLRIRIGPANEREEFVDVPILGGHLGHDLLGEDVERRLQESRRCPAGRRGPPARGPAIPPARRA